MAGLLRLLITLPFLWRFIATLCWLYSTLAFSDISSLLVFLFTEATTTTLSQHLHPWGRICRIKSPLLRIYRVLWRNRYNILKVGFDGHGMTSADTIWCTLPRSHTVGAWCTELGTKEGISSVRSRRGGEWCAGERPGQAQRADKTNNEDGFPVRRGQSALGAS